MEVNVEVLERTDGIFVVGSLVVQTAIVAANSSGTVGLWNNEEG